MIGGRSALLAAAGSKAADPWTPANIATYGWYDASASSSLELSGTAVTRWWNKKTVGSGELVWFRKDPGPFLKTNALNGLNVVSLGAGTLTVGSPGFLPNGAPAFYIVSRSLALTGAAYVTHNGQGVGAQNGGTNQLAAMSYGVSLTYAGTPNTNFHMFGYEIGPTGNILYDGVLVATRTGFSNVSSGNSNLYGYFDNGAEVAEIVAFGSALSSQDRDKLFGYFAHKWGLTSNLPSDHPYKNSRPTV